MNLSDNSYLKGDLDKQQLSYGSIKFQLLKMDTFHFFLVIQGLIFSLEKLNSGEFKNLSETSIDLRSWQMLNFTKEQL